MPFFTATFILLLHFHTSAKLCKKMGGAYANYFHCYAIMLTTVQTDQKSSSFFEVLDNSCHVFNNSSF